MQLPNNPTTSLLSIYPREVEAYIHINTHTRMFIASLFVIGKNYKQPKFPSTAELLNYVLSTQWSVKKNNNIAAYNNTAESYIMLSKIKSPNPSIGYSFHEV